MSEQDNKKQSESSTPAASTGAKEEWLISALQKQSEEVALEGHYGWGNTMACAAESLSVLQRENTVLRLLLAERDTDAQLPNPLGDETPVAESPLPNAETGFAFLAPPWDKSEARITSKKFAKFYWWSWHPNYPYWSRSCWGGVSIQEAFQELLRPLAIKMRLYHNKLIREGDLVEVADLPPCEDANEWNRSVKQTHDTNERGISSQEEEKNAGEQKEASPAASVLTEGEDI